MGRTAKRIGRKSRADPGSTASQAVPVAVGVASVGRAVAVRVGRLAEEPIGAGAGDLVPVTNGVAVGVGQRRVGAELKLLVIVDPVVVAVGGGERRPQGRRSEAAPHVSYRSVSEAVEPGSAGDFLPIRFTVRPDSAP